MGYSLCTDKGLIELYWNPCLFYRSYSYAYHVERSLLLSCFLGFFFWRCLPRVIASVHDK